LAALYGHPPFAGGPGQTGRGDAAFQVYGSETVKTPSKFIADSSACALLTKENELRKGSQGYGQND
jgi:hypothetical protein